jgi:hypothetical protein
LQPAERTDAISLDQFPVRYGIGLNQVERRWRPDAHGQGASSSV